jgi:hypothetical protein
LTNKLDTPLLVRQPVPADLPSFLDTEVALDSTISIAPRDTAVITVDVSVAGQIQPGSYLLLFEIPVEWLQGGQTQRSTLVASHPIDVSVLGESQILTALGVPSFLVVPGMLMIIFFRLLWQWGKSSEQQNAFALNSKSPEFFGVAITLSFLVFPFYWLLTGRNYFAGYNLNDITFVWLLSVGLGVVAFGMWTGVPWLWQRARQHWLIPSASDTPVQALSKLGRRKLGTRLERVDFGEDGTTYHGFLLQEVQEEQTECWIAPAIELTWKNAERKLQKDARSFIAEEQVAELAELLARGEKNGDLMVRWKRQGAFDRPRRIACQSLERLGSSMYIISSAE